MNDDTTAFTFAASPWPTCAPLRWAKTVLPASLCRQGAHSPSQDTARALPCLGLTVAQIVVEAQLDKARGEGRALTK